MEMGLNFYFSLENNYVHNLLSLLHALKHNTCLCCLGWHIANTQLEKRTPWGTPSQGAAAPESWGQEHCGVPALLTGVGSSCSTVLCSAHKELLPVSGLHLWLWEWCELVLGHIILVCVWRYVVCNKQIVAAASEELISILSPSCSSP